MERFDELVKRDFAKRLKEARKAAGYQHANAFARAMGEEEHTYRSWERGQYLPDIPKMARLCQLLDLEPNELVPLAVAKAKKKQTPGSSETSGRAA
jgi:transcriptional regulator with XRE-family HTH domain